MQIHDGEDHDTIFYAGSMLMKQDKNTKALSPSHGWVMLGILILANCACGFDNTKRFPQKNSFRFCLTIFYVYVYFQ